MRAAFYHAHFLPWLGYFSKIEYSDLLVVLDKALFRRNYIKRVKILGTDGEPEWLTLPVGNNRAIPSDEITLPQDIDYRAKILRTIELSYRRASSFAAEIETVRSIFLSAYRPGSNLVQANVQAIVELRKAWTDRPTNIVYASTFSLSKDRNVRMVEICKQLGVTEILAGDGKMMAVHDIEYITANGIKFVRQPFKESHPIYPQHHRVQRGLPFVPGLSILDAFLNVGRESMMALLKSPALEPVRWDD